MLFFLLLFVVILNSALAAQVTSLPLKTNAEFSEEAFFKSLSKDKNFQKLNEEEKYNLISHALILIDARKQEEKSRKAESERLRQQKIQQEKERRFQLERKIIKEYLLKKVKTPIMNDFITLRY
jgi:hypothetical protein